MVRKSVLVQEIISQKSKNMRSSLQEVTKGEFLQEKSPPRSMHSQLNEWNFMKIFASGSAPLLSKLFGLPKAFALCTTARCALSPCRGARGEWIWWYLYDIFKISKVCKKSRRRSFYSCNKWTKTGWVQLKLFFSVFTPKIGGRWTHFDDYKITSLAWRSCPLDCWGWLTFLSASEWGDFLKQYRILSLEGCISSTAFRVKQ